MQTQASNTYSTPHKIWNILSPAQRRSATKLLGLMFIGMALETLGISLVIPAIVLLTQSNYVSEYPVLIPILEALGNPSRMTLVTIGMLSLLGVYLIKNVFLAFLAWRQTYFTYSVGAQLSQNLFKVYLTQPYTFHLQRNSAQLLRNVLSEINIFSGALSALMLMVTEVLVLLGLCTMIVFIEPVSSLVVMVVVGVATWGFHRITRRQLLSWGKKRQFHEGLRIQHLQQGIGGAKDVILLGRETDFLDQYHLHNSQSAEVARKMSTLKQFPRLWLELLAIGGLVSLVLSMLWQGREVEAVLPMLGLFAAVAFRLMPSTNRILGAVQTIRYDLPVINTIYDELQLATSSVKTNKNTSAKPFHDVLEFFQVGYTYAGASSSALRNLSLTIHHGESVGFIGTSGAGKSTLVDILLGLLTPCVGEIRVDGQDIQANLRDWQNQIGYVPQSIYLTDDTLRRNVAFGLPNEVIDESAVQRAIRIAQLEEFINTLPEGLDTQVGERGVRLSGGQRQRIGIARALYHDPSILVLDEATSSLDLPTEKSVMDAVNALHGKKTIIIVAHRLSTVENCDCLYRIENGEIIEEGIAKEVLGIET